MGAQTGSAAAPGRFDSLDDAKINRFQLKIMFVSGMGFFTDAYDLFVIGIVVALLKPEWNLSTGQVSWLNSATLLASAVGAIVFGRIADILGRKRIYGYEVLILAIGALASAFAPNYTFLLICRIILGIGIGGDYPVSATIMSEYSGKQTRGRMVGLVFAMQGAGLIVGPLVASILLGSGISNDYTWRILLALGAIPGLAVFYRQRPGPAVGRGIEGEESAECARRLHDPGQEPPDAAVADWHRGLLGAAGLLLLRQHDLHARDPQAAQPARLAAAQYAGPAGDLRGVCGARLH